MAWIRDPQTLQSAAEKLVPPEANGIVEVASLADYYEHGNDIHNWRCFAAPGKNYAVYRADFMLSAPPRAATSEYDSPVRVAIHGQETEREKVPATEEQPVSLLTAIQASELWLTKARRIGKSLVIPGMTVSYTNLDFIAGYGGYKAWLIEGEDKDPADSFWLPVYKPGHTVSRDTGNGFQVFNKAGERVTMPNLGAVCTRQILDFGTRLSEVDISQKVSQ